MLRKTVENFVERFKGNDYAKLLAPLNEIAVAVESDEERIQFICREDGIEVCENLDAKLVLFGNDDSLKKVLNGEMRLQKGILLDQIKYKGNFRALLMIESMFYLCKQKVS